MVVNADAPLAFLLYIYKLEFINPKNLYKKLFSSGYVFLSNNGLLIRCQ